MIEKTIMKTKLFFLGFGLKDLKVILNMSYFWRLREAEVDFTQVSL